MVKEPQIIHNEVSIICANFRNGILYGKVDRPFPKNEHALSGCAKEVRQNVHGMCPFRYFHVSKSTTHYYEDKIER